MFVYSESGVTAVQPVRYVHKNTRPHCSYVSVLGELPPSPQPNRYLTLGVLSSVNLVFFYCSILEPNLVTTFPRLDNVPF